MSNDRIIRKLPPIRGIAQFPHLNTPDTYKNQTKYKLNLIVDPALDSVQTYLKVVEGAMAEYKEAFLAGIPEKIKETKPGKQGEERRAELEALLADLPLANIFEPEYDEAGEETGKIVLKLSHPASFKNRKTGQEVPIRPKLFALVVNEMTGDSVAQELKPDQAPEIWGGSELIVNGDTRPFFVENGGMVYPVLRVNGVLIARLRTAGSNITANDFGDTSDVEAISAPAAAPAAAPSEAMAAAGADEEEDF